MMRRILGALVGVLLATTHAHAAVVFSQTNESISVTSSCATIISEGGYTTCEENEGHASAPSDVSIVTSIPGYSGSMPSGSRVMRVFTDAQTAQADAGVGIGNGSSSGYDDYIPADAWWQVAMYVNNSGAEVPANLKDRPMKLFYPCKDDYPCGSGARGGYFLIQTAHSTSFEPFNDTSLAADTTGAMWLITRDNTEGTVNYAGAEAGAESKLGQTNLTEWIKANRWNVIRCHTDFTDTASGKIDCWIGAMGSALTHVMSWHGGVAVEGSAFTWTIPDATGHRAMLMPSTQPSNNVFPQTLYTYYDDFYVATAEADLPDYTGTEAPGSRAFMPFHLRR